MGNKKRKKRGSNSSVHNDTDMTNEGDIRNSIEALTEAMEAGFASLHAELDKLRLEFKHELDEMSSIGNGGTSALLDGANSLPIVLFKKWGKSLGIKMEFFETALDLD